MAETVLVVGASGIIGNSVIIAALRTGRKILAIVRNEASKEKMFKHLQNVPNARESITTVAADIMSRDGVQGVVDKVKADKLPAFQHVYAAVGLLIWTSPLQDVDDESFERGMQVNVAANFFAYRATMPYLLDSGGPNATYTLITGGAGELGFAGVTGISQGALFSMANVASRENDKTNVRFNEVYLAYRVEFDEDWEKKSGKDCTKASDFSKVYEDVLFHTEVRGSRFIQDHPDDLKKFKVKKKIQPHWVDGVVDTVENTVGKS